MLKTDKGAIEEENADEDQIIDKEATSDICM